MKGKKGCMKRGGAAKHLEEMHGATTHHRKHGGHVDGKELEHMHGHSAKHRLDRPGRKRGGRVGADMAPLSSAGRGDHPHSASDQMAHGGSIHQHHHHGNAPHHKHAHHRATGGRTPENEVAGKGSIAEEVEGHKRGGHVGHHEKKKLSEGGAAGGKWIAGAVKHPGALHKQLGVPQGEKIPEKKLSKAAHSSNPLLAKRAHLAQTLKGFHH
jgi:hypothetical protein